MKRKIFLFIMMFSIVGVVNALSIEEFFASDPSCKVNAVNPLVRDCQTGEMTISYTTNIEKNTISFETTETNVAEVISKSSLFLYLFNNSPQELMQQYKAVHSSDKKPEYEKNLCNMDLTGYCFSSDGEINTMEVRIDDTFIKFLIVQHGGVPVEQGEDEQKEVVEAPVTETQQGETTTGDSKNPETGSFAEYGLVVLLFGALLFVIYLKRRSEIEFKI